MIVSRFLLKTRLQVEKLTKENCDALGSAHERKVQFLKQSHSSVEIPIFYERKKDQVRYMKISTLLLGLIHHNCLIGDFFPIVILSPLFFHSYTGKLLYVLILNCTWLITSRRDSVVTRDIPFYSDLSSNRIKIIKPGVFFNNRNLRLM